MKKSQFQEIDLFMINKLTKEYGFNIQSKEINTNNDFQSYCKKILDRKYLGYNNIVRLSSSIDLNAQEQKENILKDWCRYLTKENDTYNPAIQLMILSSITKKLDKTTNYLPPILDKGKVADTISEIIENSRTNKNYQPNFEKIYKNNLEKAAIEDEENLDSTHTCWVEIPSRIHDSSKFQENIIKLQTLSCENWCTKTYNAKQYLNDGDFHIYLENGKPKLGIRFRGDTIQEIQGEKNNSRIPIHYLDTLKNHIKKGKYEKNYKTDNQLRRARERQNEIKKIKEELGEDVFSEGNIKYDKILTYFGFKVKKDKDGLLTLNYYNNPGSYDFEDLGIKENDMFKHIKEIKGDAYFMFSQLDNLGSLESIGGSAYFNHSKIKSLGNLKTIKECTLPFSSWQIKEINDKLSDITSKEEYTRDDAKKIFDTVCLKYKEDRNGLLVIKKYDNRFDGLNVDKNKILPFIKESDTDVKAEHHNRKIEDFLTLLGKFFKF